MKHQIIDLLENSAQMFDDYSEEQLEEFRAGFADRQTLESTPVVIAMVEGKPVLVEGRQRLRILLASGREELNANEAVTVKGVSTMQAAQDEAIVRNANRRQLDAAQLTPVAIRLRDERGLTQREVARVLGITQGWVSKLFAQAEREAVAEATQRMANALEPVDPTGALTGVTPQVPQQPSSPENEAETAAESVGFTGPMPTHEDIPATPPRTPPLPPAPLVGLQSLRSLASGVFMALNDLPGAMALDERGSANIDAWLISVTPGREKRAERIRDALTQASQRYAALAARIDAALAAEKVKA